MKKIFLDSDVILDFLLSRTPFNQDIAKVLSMGMYGKLDLYTSPLIVANLHYLISKYASKKEALTSIEKISKIMTILSLGEKEIMAAVSSKISDFEDAIQNECAVNADMDIILTRNVKDYKQSKLAILTPLELLTKNQ